MPSVSPGRPASVELTRYRAADVGGITVHHPPTLGVKPGFAVIRIRLRGALFWRWLELEGARAIAEMTE